MNLDTGKIAYLDDEEIKNELKDSWIRICESSMTKKQKEEMQVSKYDNKSELGKLYTMNRHERRKFMKKGFKE